MAFDLNWHHRWEKGASGAPTLLLLHGTGGNEDDLLDLGRSVLPNANLLSPRGQVDENGMARFFRRLSEGVFDLEDLRYRTTELAKFVADASKAHEFDVARVIALGFSNGANIAASLLLSGTGTLAGALLLHPMVPFEPSTLPSLAGVRVFISAGEQDAMVPRHQTQRLAELLGASGASVETAWQPGGHRLSRPEIEMAMTWAQKGDQPWN